MTKKTKKLAVAAAVILTAGIGIFVACDREVDTGTDATQGASTLNTKTANDILIGQLVNGDIVCGVDLDEFSDTLWAQTHTYVAETLEN